LLQFDKDINYRKLLIKEKVKEYRFYAKQKTKFLIFFCKNKVRIISLRYLCNNYFNNKISKLTLKRQRFVRSKN